MAVIFISLAAIRIAEIIRARSNVFRLTEMIAVLRVHGPTNNQICKPAITMIRHLAAIKANVSRLIEAGAPEGAGGLFVS